MSTMYSSKSRVSTDDLCRPSRASKSQVQLANRAIFLRHNRDPINHEHIFAFVFQFELTTLAQPTVFNWGIYEGLKPI